MAKIANEQIKFENSICCDRKTYFFGYVYPKYLREYKEHKRQTNKMCMNLFGMRLNDLYAIEDKSPQMKKVIRDYYKYQPLFNSKSAMNALAKYIEDIEFDNIFSHNTKSFDYHCLLSDKDFKPKKAVLKKVSENIFELNKYYKRIVQSMRYEEETFVLDNEESKENRFKPLFDCYEETMLGIISNEKELVDYLIYSYYNSYPSYSKTMLWNVFGEQIFKNVKSGSNVCYMLEQDDNGFDYYGTKYSLREVDICD